MFRDEKGLGGRGSSASERQKQNVPRYLYFGLYASWSQVTPYHLQRPHRCLNDTCLGIHPFVFGTCMPLSLARKSPGLNRKQ